MDWLFGAHRSGRLAVASTPTADGVRTSSLLPNPCQRMFRLRMQAAVPQPRRRPPAVMVVEDVFPVLLAAAKGGDEDAFRPLYRAVQPLLLRYLHSLVGDEAEDVAAETWLHVVRDLSTFEGDFDGFRSWAATIARHRAMDHLRRLRVRPALTVPNEAFTELADEADTAVLATDRIATDAAVRLIAALPRDQAEAVFLRVVVALDARSAGMVVGKRAGAVRSAAHRGLRRLTQLLRRPSSEDS
jgi:RNA polymerase sigma-70 factor (ECF subfamily)